MEQKEEKKVFGTWTENNKVLKGSRTDADSCSVEGRWLQLQIKHKENVFLCVWVYVSP